MHQNTDRLFDAAEQSIPVRVYQTADRIMVAAPMPGLDPENIRISVRGRQVVIRGDDRAPRQDERDMIVSEWRIGPYYREITLPQPVDGKPANATYGNGVLVLSLPKTKNGEADAPADFQLQAVESTHGERVGHIGQEIRPTTTQAHSRKHR